MRSWARELVGAVVFILVGFWLSIDDIVNVVVVGYSKFVAKCCYWYNLTLGSRCLL